MSQSARRRFLAAVCASALVDPFAFLTPVFAQAKAPEKVKRIGFLWVASQADQTKDISAFEQKLRELGHVQGRDIKLEYRFASGRNELLPDQAVDLVRSKVDVIVAATNPAIIAAKQATTSIPIVMVIANDPVRAGFVASLAHPGGNITGLTFDVGDDIWGKRLELLKEAAPKMVRVGVIWNPDYPPNPFRWKVIEAAARQLGLTLVSAPVRRESDLEKVLAELKHQGAEGIQVFGDALVYVLRGQIAKFAIENRLPNISPYRAAVDAGGLLSLGIDLTQQYGYSAVYVDKILRGVRPADLPVERPIKFELVVNLKIAKALGLAIPQSILLRADEVIE
jgi:putative ABC transport system substrate-binding protein